ncbi:MAG: glycoside hydrolase [Gemmatimonadales bacterium]
MRLAPSPTAAPRCARRRALSVLLACGAMLAVLAQRTAAQQVDPRLYQDLRWRLVGPFRGGRTVAAVGVRGQPNTFYIGVNNGGVWKTTDAGRVWTPIFDSVSTGSVGAIAVAPSDPNTIYVGSGEGLQRPDLSVGDGIYKSTDGGRSWRHLGLRDGQQIAQVLVDPRDANRVFAAVLGHPYGPNEERGVFRSLDGGETWQRVLYRDAHTGAMDLAFDPSNPDVLYAVLWAAQQAPWENGWSLSANNGLYKSTDGGTTWRQVGEGLPSAADGLGRIGIGTSASEPNRLYAIVGANRGQGVYRSEDGGEHWRLVNADARVSERDGDFNEIKVDPRNADVVYSANVVTWKSTDGGVTFHPFRGAPGGDDYHRLWINPDDPRIILNASDQGAVITVNGGETWSSWYNQPSAQLFHIITDNGFPYRIYGGQQESGSMGILSRGNDGQITYREWHPVGVEEYGYVAPDPLHPNLVYGGKITRFDWNTGQVQNVSPEAGGGRGPGRYRFVRTAPVIFSPVDPHLLYFAGNVLFKTLNGGQNWQTISPDLTRDSLDSSGLLGPYAPLDPEHGRHRGVIYTIAPSFRRVSLLWVGTDDGLIWVTHDGGAHWRNVTPPALTPWSKVSLMEASHTDTLEAYAAINRFRLDDLHPHIWRTRDGGATWTEIVAGIPENEVVDVVREDPARKGLLFAGTERSVYVSFDDGNYWQPLRLNLPGSSVRDLWIHEQDLIAGTHGRGAWVLDDITPLRQAAEAAAAEGVYLYRPARATRVRWNEYTDTPLPIDEPAAPNPPDGAVLDYYLPAPATTPVVLEILDRTGALVRRFASDDAPEPVDSGANIPLWWVRPSQRLGTGAGMHRFVWDLRYPVPPALRFGYPIAAVIHNTPREPRGPWALPGEYRVRLTVNGQRLEQPLTLRMDPRVPATSLVLQQQFALSRRMAGAMVRDSAALAGARAPRAGAAGGARADSLVALSRDLTRLNGQLAGVLGIAEGADAAPTTQALQAAAALERTLEALEARLAALRR